MLTITPGYDIKKSAEVIARLERLSLSFTINPEDKNLPILLCDGEYSFSHPSEIDTYLNELEDELKQWYYCAC